MFVKTRDVAANSSRPEFPVPTMKTEHINSQIITNYHKIPSGELT